MKKGHYEPPEPWEAGRPSLGGTEPFEALFEHARRDAFTPEQAERLWQSVVAGGPGGGDGGPDIPEGPTQGWASGATLKVAAALVVAGGVFAAGFAARRSAPPPPTTPPNGAPRTTQGIEASRDESEPPVISWEDLPRAQSAQRPAAPAPPRGHNPSVQPAEPAPPAEPESAGAEAPTEPEPPPVAPAPEPSEGALLLRARQQLASDPSSSFELTEEAGRRFPDGALAPEREVLAIEALARLGRLSSARARLAAFRVLYPQSPHLARLESLVAP